MLVIVCVVHLYLGLPVLVIERVVHLYRKITSVRYCMDCASVRDDNQC